MAEGQSISRVAEWAANLPELARGGRQLSSSALTRTLKSVTPLGLVTLDGPPARWSPLIDRPTWDAVQAYIAQHYVTPHQATGRYLRTGLARCPKCGARMRGWTRPLRQDYGDKHRLYAYKCNGIPTKGCSFVVPGGRAIDTQVRDAVSVLLEHVASHTRGGLEVAWSQLANPDTSADRAAQVAGLKRAADKARTRLTRAATLLVDGELDRASYDLLREAAQADLEAAETELSHLRRGTNAAPVLPSLDVVMQAVGSWSRALQDSDTTTQRDVFALLLERVQVARLGWGRYQAKVIWTPLGAALASLQATQIA